jgi:uncharacterized membrane protein YfcA
MDPADTAILTGVAFATATLSATVGLGGGMILLTVMLLYLEPLAAIPLHGVIQLVSNSSRTYIQRRHVRWRILAYYGLPLLPLGYVGLAFARSLTPQQLKLGIGLFVLLATWGLPGLSASRARLRARQFVWLGAVVGVLNVTVGATGPLVGPFFRNLGLPRQGVVGTFSACQTAGHLAKIVVFGTAGFAFGVFLLPLASMSAGVVGGTWVGSQLLERVPESLFRGFYRAALTLVALRLVLWDGLGLL